MNRIMDQNSTLEELENKRIGEPEFQSSLVQAVHKLYRKPLSDFTVVDLRLMINQSAGLEFLVPLALEELEKSPLAAGDYYPGDLLLTVLKVNQDFWGQHQELYWSFYETVAGLPEIFRNLAQAIEEFQSRALDSSTQHE